MLRPLGCDWERVLPRVVLSVPRVRTLVDFASAADALGCFVDDVEDIVAAGAPSSNGRVDLWDMLNIGLYSRSGRTKPEFEMAAFARATGTDPRRWLGVRGWAVTVSAECESGECIDPQWEPPVLSDDQWVESPRPKGSPQWSATVVANGEVRKVRSRILRDIFRDVQGAYRFQYTHPGVVGRNADTRLRGTGTCTSIAAVLAEEIRRVGREAVLRHGLLMGLFTASLHCWVDVADDDGKWVTLDPTMPIVVRDFFGLVDNDAISDFFCGSSSNRIAPLPAYRPLTGQLEDRLMLKHCCAGIRVAALATAATVPVSSTATAAVG